MAKMNYLSFGMKQVKKREKAISLKKIMSVQSDFKRRKNSS